MEASGALDEAIIFLKHFQDLPNTRQAAKVQAAKVVYPLDEVLLLSLLAVLAGAEIFTDIARLRWVGSRRPPTRL